MCIVPGITIAKLIKLNKKVAAKENYFVDDYYHSAVTSPSDLLSCYTGRGVRRVQAFHLLAG